MSWLQIRNGSAFFPQKPRAEQIDPATIAVVLARLPRFGGHSINTLNVATHCVLCADWLAEQGRPAREQLAGLLHDAHEAYTGFGDVAHPVKPHWLVRIEQGIDRVLAPVFGLRYEELHSDWVQRADLVLLATEKRDQMGPEPCRWGVLYPPWHRKVESWTEDVARSRWMEKFLTLTGKGKPMGVVTKDFVDAVVAFGRSLFPKTETEWDDKALVVLEQLSGMQWLLVILDGILGLGEEEPIPVVTLSTAQEAEVQQILGLSPADLIDMLPKIIAILRAAKDFRELLAGLFKRAA